MSSASRVPERCEPSLPDDRSSGVELRLPHGCGVALQRGFDRQTLADVLAVLQTGAAREAGA